MLFSFRVKTLLHVSLFLFGIHASAAVVTADGKGKRGSIVPAIENAEEGDTILVRPGHYREGNIAVHKSLTLLADGRVVVDGENKYEVFSLSGKDITISGFSIINSGASSISDLAGIGAIDCYNLTIRNCEFRDNFFGIHISNSRNITIENNRLIVRNRAEGKIANGIHLWQSGNALIRNNSVGGHRDGIYFEFVTGSRIENNRSEGNLRYGLHFMFSHDDEYHHNIFRKNGAGVAVMYTRHVTMTYNRFEDNWGSSIYGLLLKDISDSRVVHNRFVRNTMAIYMEGTSRTFFEENTFSSNGWAVRLQASCDGNSFTMNNFTGNTFDFATNGSLVLNRVNGNYWDKYQGYDLNRDGIGDLPYRPVNLFTMIVERIPPAILLWRSFLVFLLDRAEKIFPAVTPENLKDESPSLKAYDFSA